jgi:RND superfamily putative drug exporter
MAFIVLVAVGADYNMLLISRIRDESPDAMRSGVIRTIRSTGVIASAGMIFAVLAMSALMGPTVTEVNGPTLVALKME